MGAGAYAERVVSLEEELQRERADRIKAERDEKVGMQGLGTMSWSSSPLTPEIKQQMKKLHEERVRELEQELEQEKAASERELMALSLEHASCCDVISELRQQLAEAEGKIDGWMRSGSTKVVALHHHHTAADAAPEQIAPSTGASETADRETGFIDTDTHRQELGVGMNAPFMRRMHACFVHAGLHTAISLAVFKASAIHARAHPRYWIQRA